MRLRLLEALALLCLLVPGAAAARPIAAVPFPGQEKQRQVSQEEYQAFQALRQVKDPAQKVAQAQAFLQKFPQTPIRDLVLVVMMQGYHQLGQRDKALKAGQEAVEANPDSYAAYYDLGVEYLATEPRDFTLGIWNLARALVVAKAAQAPAAAEIEQSLKKVYREYQDSDEGLEQVLVQAAASPAPPAEFHIPDPSLFGSRGVSVEAVRQGGLGSCYFHSTVAALALSNPQGLESMVHANGDGTFSVRFADGEKETAYLDDLRYARQSRFDRSDGLWVGILFRAYAQRVLRESLIEAVEKSELLPLLKPYVEDFLKTNDPLLLAYDRSIRAVVEQSGDIDSAKLEAELQGFMKPIQVPDQVKESLLKMLESGGFFNVIAQTVKENGELFGAYRAIGLGGMPSRVMKAFLGGDPRMAPTSSPQEAAALLAQACRDKRPVVAGTLPLPVEKLAAAAPLPQETGKWYVVSHAYTVLAFDPNAQTVTLRNPWGDHPSPDGTFTIPLATFLETFREVDATAP
jgi:tetratricopeptide (TPR) repeat protein